MWCWCACRSGDVDTSEERDIADDRTVKGLSGRTLKLGPWPIPTNKVRLGIKRAFEIFPGGLVKRITEDRKRNFDEAQRGSLVAAQRRCVRYALAARLGLNLSSVNASPARRVACGCGMEQDRQNRWSRRITVTARCQQSHLCTLAAHLCWLASLRTRRLAEWAEAHKSPTEAERREKKDLIAVVDALGEAAEQYADAGEACAVCVCMCVYMCVYVCVCVCVCVRACVVAHQLFALDRYADLGNVRDNNWSPNPGVVTTLSRLAFPTSSC